MNQISGNLKTSAWCSKILQENPPTPEGGQVGSTQSLLLQNPTSVGFLAYLVAYPTHECCLRLLVYIYHINYLYHMSSIVINPKDPQELQFLSDLLQKLGVNSKILSDEDAEDLGLAILMKDVDRSDTVFEEEILRKLNS